MVQVHLHTAVALQVSLGFLGVSWVKHPQVGNKTSLGIFGGWLITETAYLAVQRRHDDDLVFSSLFF